ncbi:MAG: hypothetical protein K2H76_06520 [Muribaculaceae bacterium]|nr:hypothetical protein [Muribaculaceae bacterium]
MTTQRHNIDKERLLKRIDDYFECRLSDEEEHLLLRDLAATPLSDPAIDEAKAVMGFRTINRKNQAYDSQPVSHRRSALFRRFTAAAASVAILFSIGMCVNFFDGNNGEDRCFAYVNGKKITDEKEVEKLLLQNLSEFGDSMNDAQEGLFDEIGELAPVAELFDSQLDPSEI